MVYHYNGIVFYTHKGVFVNQYIFNQSESRSVMHEQTEVFLRNLRKAHNLSDTALASYADVVVFIDDLVKQNNNFQVAYSGISSQICSWEIEYQRICIEFIKDLKEKFPRLYSQDFDDCGAGDPGSVEYLLLVIQSVISNTQTQEEFLRREVEEFKEIGSLEITEGITEARDNTIAELKHLESGLQSQIELCDEGVSRINEEIRILQSRQKEFLDGVSARIDTVIGDKNTYIDCIISEEINAQGKEYILRLTDTQKVLERRKIELNKKLRRCKNALSVLLEGMAEVSQQPSFLPEDTGLFWLDCSEDAIATLVNTQIKEVAERFVFSLDLLSASDLLPLSRMCYLAYRPKEGGDDRFDRACGLVGLYLLYKCHDIAHIDELSLSIGDLVNWVLENQQLLDMFATRFITEADVCELFTTTLQKYMLSSLPSLFTKVVQRGRRLPINQKYFLNKSLCIIAGNAFPSEVSQSFLYFMYALVVQVEKGVFSTSVIKDTLS